MENLDGFWEALADAQKLWNLGKFRGVALVGGRGVVGRFRGVAGCVGE